MIIIIMTSMAIITPSEYHYNIIYIYHRSHLYAFTRYYNYRVSL